MYPSWTWSASSALVLVRVRVLAVPDWARLAYREGMAGAFRCAAGAGAGMRAGVTGGGTSVRGCVGCGVRRRVRRGGLGNREAAAALQQEARSLEGGPWRAADGREAAPVAAPVGYPQVRGALLVPARKSTRKLTHLHQALDRGRKTDNVSRPIRPGTEVEILVPGAAWCWCQALRGTTVSNAPVGWAGSARGKLA